MSFSSGSSNASKGGCWTGLMYFDPQASSSGGKRRFTDDELREELLEVIEPDEKILKVFVFDCPLMFWQITKIFLKHSFIILKTNKWWWSLEKNTEGLTLQRDKDLAAVRDRYRQNERATGFRGVNEAIQDEGQGNMEDLVKWLLQKDVLNQSYGLLSSNCQQFAKLVFDHVAVKKSYQM